MPGDLELNPFPKHSYHLVVWSRFTASINIYIYIPLAEASVALLPASPLPAKLREREKEGGREKKKRKSAHKLYYDSNTNARLVIVVDLSKGHYLIAPTLLHHC